MPPRMKPIDSTISRLMFSGSGSSTQSGTSKWPVMPTVEDIFSLVMLEIVQGLIEYVFEYFMYLFLVHVLPFSESKTYISA
jgi:hypothetical protein